ncbi:PIN domain-containing protein [Thermomonospora cellulosilytica]|uniref:Putative nucleic acid-binding protein n=1 Tax=Thermomonospora cellulosilytica TaxID=1411118 RepID=A0A7W3MUR2_9ACTN|nr:PIN domain-containing protein [Thermomonospora cellulosilytica]MBA9002197.1 putative nucleic acid-binding protein [Thermomonospora cellulosilytica]
MPFSAVLDACVLYPNALRDTLLRIAEAGIYQPLWSDKILEEVHGVLERKGRRADYVIECIRQAFPDALVHGWENLEGSMTNHPKDRHVLAAAVRGHADVIVTMNLKDFPASSVEGLDIEVQHPDTFLCYELEHAPYAIMQVLFEQAEDTGKQGRPQLTVHDVLDELVRCGAKEFAHQVRQWLAESDEADLAARSRPTE